MTVSYDTNKASSAFPRGRHVPFSSSSLLTTGGAPSFLPRWRVAVYITVISWFIGLFTSKLIKMKYNKNPASQLQQLLFKQSSICSLSYCLSDVTLCGTAGTQNIPIVTDSSKDSASLGDTSCHSALCFPPGSMEDMWIPCGDTISKKVAVECGEPYKTVKIERW